MVAARPRPELLVITGPTASGKSDLALKVAQEFHGEIISADSWSVYRGFDIGTSKPTTIQQNTVKHHLIDVREATDGFNAPMFKFLAEKAIRKIHQNGNLPIIVGGTGLYIDSVLYDFSFLPSVSSEVREKLNQLSLGELLKLAGELKIDLSSIDIRNKRRVIRAIEAKGKKPTKRRLRPHTIIIGLQPDPEILEQRIEKRVEQMLDAGLEQEVKKLAKRYGWEIEPMKGIGYREWKDYFDGQESLENTGQRIILASKKLAKRQRTWLKRNQDTGWYSSQNQAYNYLQLVLNKRSMS